METKGWWESRGIWGTLIAGISLVLQLTGVGEIAPEEQATLAENITNIAIMGGGIIGIVLAFIGRLKAKVPIA